MKKSITDAVEGVVVDDNPTLRTAAADAIKKGALAAKEAAVNVAVSPVKLAEKALYGACYGLAYGAVYGALVIGNTLPQSGSIRKGLHEGLESAVKDFDAKHQESAVTIDRVVDSVVSNS